MAPATRAQKSGVHHWALRGFLQTFVPHAGNDFHPHLIRPVGLIAVGVVVGLLFAGSSSTRVESVKGASAGISKESLLVESNKVRQAEGVPKVSLNDSLSSAAGLKARDMLVRQYWEHTAPDGTTPWYWFREVNYRYDYAGENLAKGFTDATGVISGWMNSEEHRKNALGVEYQDVGFGVAQGELKGEQTTIVVAMYGSPVGSPALSSPEVLAATVQDMSLATQLGVKLQLLDPLALGSLAILAITSAVSLGAYAFRDRLPKGVKRDWKRHHALYKALVTACLILMLFTFYGSGELL